MNVGDYVITKDRLHIGKIYNINECREPTMIYAIDFPNVDDFIFMGENDFTSSPNIIDLIEVGDYVNGEKVCYLKGDINDSEVAHKEDVLYTEYVDEYGEWYGYAEDEIETIATKEQFEAIQYKLGKE